MTTAMILTIYPILSAPDAVQAGEQARALMNNPQYGRLCTVQMPDGS